MGSLPRVVYELLQRLEEIGEYPPLVKAVDSGRRISGTAFFPGGFGLWSPGGVVAALPPRPVVIVGHNWGTPRDHDEAFEEGCEFDEDWEESKRRACATWWNLLPMLRGAGIEPGWCFFTNAYMGLKADTASNVGPMRVDEEFARRCVEYLGFQLGVLRPGLVIAMGEEARGALARLYPEPAAWRGPRGGHRGVVQLRIARVDLVSPQSEERAFVLAVIAHTCDRRNLSEGLNEEIALIRRAMTMRETGR